MAPRASWKGYLKLSLVSCPVRLYPATSTSDRVRFNQLHKDTHNRINMKPVDPELGLVERSDLVKGYEYEDKKYIIIEDSDLESVRIESNHTMNIEAFVDEGSVDVIYQDGSRTSNRKVPATEVDTLDGDGPIRAFIEAQDRTIAERSGNPRGPIKSITRAAG